MPVFSTSCSSIRPAFLRLAPAPMTRIGLLASSIAFTRRAHRLGLRTRAARDALGQRLEIGALFLGDILGQFDQGGAGLFLLGKAIGFAHAAGDVVSGGDLDRIFGDRPHQLDDVDDLENGLAWIFLIGFCPVIISTGIPPNWP